MSVQDEFSFRRALRLSGFVPPLIAFALVFLLWELVARLNPHVLPSLGAVGGSLAEDPQMYVQNFLVTLQEVAVGAGVGILGGFLLAVAMSEWKILERAVMPLVIVVMVTPVVAIAPALVVVFGFSMLPKYIVTAIMVFFSMLVNSLAGLRSVDQRALAVLKTLNATRWEVFRYLRFPGSMPYVFAGLRISLPLAVVGAAVAEFVAAGEQAGLGSLITVAASQANLVVTWAAIILLAVLGILLIAILAIVRKRVLWWSESRVNPV